MERLPRLLSGKESACLCRRCRKCGFNPQERKIPQKRKWQPTLAFLHGKSHRHWSLVGYSCVCIYSTTFQLCIRLNSSLCKPLSHIKFLLYTIACCCLVAKSYLTLCNSMDCVVCWTPLSMGFPGRNTGVDCHLLLQGILPAQGSNPLLLRLLHQQ